MEEPKDNQFVANNYVFMTQSQDTFFGHNKREGLRHLTLSLGSYTCIQSNQVGCIIKEVIVMADNGFTIQYNDVGLRQQIYLDTVGLHNVSCL